MICLSSLVRVICLRTWRAEYLVCILEHVRAILSHSDIRRIPIHAPLLPSFKRLIHRCPRFGRIEIGQLLIHRLQRAPPVGEGIFHRFIDYTYLRNIRRNSQKLFISSSVILDYQIFFGGLFLVGKGLARWRTQLE